MPEDTEIARWEGEGGQPAYDPQRVFWMTAEERNSYVISPNASDLETQ